MIEFTLPFPPSVNGLFVNAKGVKGVGRFASKGYKLWIEDAMLTMAKQHPEITTYKPMFSEPVVVHYIFSRPDKRRRDISNLIKAPEDFLVRWGILADDSLVEKLSAEWTAEGEGVFIRVKEIK